MRRTGAWILGLVAVGAMAGGTWFALRPLLTRETVRVGFLTSDMGRDPSNDAMFSGAAFAVAEAGERAGKFRVQLLIPKPTDSKMPPVWIGTSEALMKNGDSQRFRFRVSTMDTHPQKVDGQFRLLAGYHQQGKSAAGWAIASGATRPFLLRDTDSPRSAAIADQFQATLPTTGLDYIGSGQAPAQRAQLLGRILAADPDLVFYSGEEAPYGTSESLFSELRAKGYAGTLAMAEADPEVSFLAVPSKMPEGTLLVSPIGAPSAEFAAKYEPATGRHAGPHGWIGYLAMKTALSVIELSESGSAEAIQEVSEKLPLRTLPCALYVFRGGRFEFVRTLDD